MTQLDISGILVGGFQVGLLVLFLTQVVREAIPRLPSRFLPVVSLAFSTALIAMRTFAPVLVTETVAQSLAVAAVITMGVRYVKRGDARDSEERRD